MRTRLLILFLLIAGVAAGQSIVPLRGDSIIISKTGDNAELVIRNATKDTVNGLLTNIGNGVTAFIKLRVVQDTLLIIGTDTLVLPGGGGGDNFANADLTLTANRTHTFGAFNMTFSGFDSPNAFSEYVIDGHQFVVSLANLESGTHIGAVEAHSGADNTSTTAVIYAQGPTDTAYFHAKADGMATIKGDLFLPDYTSGHTGTMTHYLGVDAAGNVIRDPSLSVTIDNWPNGSGAPIFYMDDPDYVWGRRVEGLGGIEITYNDSAIIIDCDGCGGGGGGDTANLIILNAGLGEQTWFDDNDSLNMKRHKDSDYILWATDTDSSLVAAIDTSTMFADIRATIPGGGGVSDATAWHVPGDAWAAYKTIGNTSNFGMGFLTNNTIRGRIDSIGTFLWAGASAQVSATAGTYYKTNFGDTSHFTAIRLGGASQITGTSGANSLLSIKGAGSSSASLISVFSAANVNPVFNVTENGLVSVPMLLGSWTSTVIRSAGASLTIGPTNGGAFSADGTTATTNSAYTSVAGTNRAIFAVAGTYTSSATSGQTGIVSGMHIISTFNQAAGATNPSAGLTINVSQTSLADYKALRIVDGGQIYTNGSLNLNTAGGKIFIATGSNASVGTSTLVGGTVTVSTTAVTASSKIFITRGVTGGTEGHLSIGTITAGTSFVINSSSGSETSQINWWIVN